MLFTMVIVQVGCFVVPVVREFLDFSLPSGPLVTVTFGAAAIGCVAIEIIFRRVSRQRGIDDQNGINDQNGIDDQNGINDQISVVPPRP